MGFEASIPEGKGDLKDFCAVVAQIERVETQLKEEIGKRRLCALDLETSSLSPRDGRILSAGIAFPSGITIVLPLEGPQAIPPDVFEAGLKPVLSDPKNTVVFHNGKFDISFLKKAGLTVKAKIADTMILEWLLDESLAGTDGLSLKSLVKKHCHFDLDTVEDYTKKGTLWAKCGPDAAATLDLWQTRYPILEKDERLCREFWEIEMPVVGCLIEMEASGVKFDVAHLARLKEKFGARIARVEKAVNAKAGHPVLLTSTQQVSRLLFDELKLKPKPFMLANPEEYRLKVKPKKGGDPAKPAPILWSTKEDIIAHYAAEEPVAGLLLRHRKAQKLLTTYAEPLLDHALADEDRRVYAHFWQAGTESGRISSSQPINLQNFPREKGLIRKAVIAPSGCVLIEADWNQLELRLMAHYCLQRNMGVTLADGTSTEIGQLVNGQQAVEVASYDFELGRVVPAKVVNYWRNGARVEESVYRAGTDDWLVLRHEGAPGRRLVLTPNHEVYRPDGSKVLAGALEVGDEMLFRSPDLTGVRKQIILGSLLGDGNFKRAKSETGEGFFPSADFYHGCHQKAYFEWKVERLAPFLTRTGWETNVWRAHVAASHHVKRLADLLMEGGEKRPTVRAIEALDVLGLAVWYMDDGSVMHDDRCSVENGWACSIANVRADEETVEAVNRRFGTGFRLWKGGLGLAGDRAKVFFALIAPFVPPSMQYKLPPAFRGLYDESRTTEPLVELSRVRIVEKRAAVFGEPLFRSSLKQATFDLEVEGLHRYFAQDILVSNSKDPKLVEEYKKAKSDVHGMTAASLGITERSIAKCLSGDTLVFTETGPVKIATLVGGIEPGEHRPIPPVSLADGKGGYVGSSQALVRHSRPAVYVVTKRGAVCCTGDHRWVLLDGSLVEAQRLEKGMRLPVGGIPPIPAGVPEEMKINPFTKEIGSGPCSFKLNEDWAYFAGMFHGDGSAVNGHTFVITHGSGPDYAEWRRVVYDACTKIGLPASQSSDERTTRLGSRVVAKYLAGLGLAGPRQKTLSVPAWVLSGGKGVVLSYLAGLFDTDGTVDSGISFTTKSPEFAGQIAVLLRAFGLPITVGPSFNQTYRKWYFRVRVWASGLKWMADNLPLRSEKMGKLIGRADEAEGGRTSDDDEVLMVLPAGERTVYDFHVDSEDHLYLQGGLIGHNNVNFGLIYGMSANRLQQTLWAGSRIKASLSDCERWRLKFFDTYREIRPYHQKIRNQIAQHGYVRSMAGRYRRVADLLAEEERTGKWKGYAFRMALNFTIQGSAADLAKLALRNFQRKIEAERATPGSLWEHVHQIVQIHDAVLVEAPISISEVVMDALKTTMETVVTLPSGIPLPVSIGMGENWEAAEADAKRRDKAKAV